MDYLIDKEINKSRIIFLDTEINDVSASRVIKQLLFYASQSSQSIYLYINSGGGSVSSGLSIIDTINHINCEVNTICFGMAASMAAVILCAGTGLRCAMPNSEIMLHSSSVDCIGGTTQDIVVQAKHFQRLNDKMIKLIAYYCNQPIEKVKRDLDRDYFLTSKEALNYGIIDKII